MIPPLDLPARAVDSLIAAGYYSTEALAKCTEEDLMRLPWIGLRTARQILYHSRRIDRLALLGLHAKIEALGARIDAL